MAEEKRKITYLKTLIWLELVVLLITLIHNEITPKSLYDRVGFGPFIANYGPWYFYALFLSPFIYLFLKYLIFENPFKKQSFKSINS